jgi:hypothetical protein
VLHIKKNAKESLVLTVSDEACSVRLPSVNAVDISFSTNEVTSRSTGKISYLSKSQAIIAAKKLSLYKPISKNLTFSCVMLQTS